jgi:hypothetical protein
MTVQYLVITHVPVVWQTIFYVQTKARQHTACINIIKFNANVLNECPNRRVENISKGQFTRMLSHFDLLHLSFTTRLTIGQSMNMQMSVCRLKRSDGGKLKRNFNNNIHEVETHWKYKFSNDVHSFFNLYR